MAFASESGRVLRFRGEYKAVYEELIEGEWIVPTRSIYFDETWYSQVLDNREIEIVIRSQIEHKPLSEYFTGYYPHWARWLDEAENYRVRRASQAIKNGR